MQISEITTRSHIGGEDAANNSYVLVNYATSENGTQVTNKVTIHELAQAIASDLMLCKYNSNTNAIDVIGYSDQSNTYTSEVIDQTQIAIDGEVAYRTYYTAYLSPDGQLAYMDGSGIPYHITDPVLFYRMESSDYIMLVDASGNLLSYLPVDSTPPGS